MTALNARSIGLFFEIESLTIILYLRGHVGRLCIHTAYKFILQYCTVIKFCIWLMVGLYFTLKHIFFNMKEKNFECEIIIFHYQ